MKVEGCFTSEFIVGVLGTVSVGLSPLFKVWVDIALGGVRLEGCL